MSLLSDDVVNIRSQGLELVLPHPINFAFQKLIISGRRPAAEKAAKDRVQAVEVLREVVARGGGDSARAKLQKLPSGWRKAILDGLKAARNADLTALLTTVPSARST